MNPSYLGIDIGTGSSKGVLVRSSGEVARTAVRSHDVMRPHPGWAEMDAAIWWDEFVSITRELLDGFDGIIGAVGVSGMGPCVLVTDDAGQPLRPAILYGIDTRATAQIAAMTAELGDGVIAHLCGSRLSTQSVGPKLRWLAEKEPHVADAARRLFMPSSWLVWHLTGEYLLDHHSASQCTPLYHEGTADWFLPWTSLIAPQIQFPELRWPGELAGVVTASASAVTGLPVGLPVILGTIDAWAEAVSVGATNPGDLMVMYGTTMFLIATQKTPIRWKSLWTTAGAFPGTNSLAAGMATSGAVTSWLRDLYGRPSFEILLEEAKQSGAGANGLLMLPYFAGERTPIADPQARGTVLGLTLSHTRGDLYRAALEATAYGVRANIDAMRNAGADIQRVVAVGGGTTGGLWTQIVSDVTGFTQEIPAHTIGASLGGAFLAARLVEDVKIRDWNPIASVVTPSEDSADIYRERYELYGQTYRATKTISHALARAQEMATTSEDLT